MSGLGIVCLLAGYSIAYIINYNPINIKDKPQSLFSEIDRHPDRYYVLDIATAEDYFKYSENYVHPLWGFRNSFVENVDGFGYFHHDETLRKRNMSENIYEAVLTNNKIYVIDKNITFKKERYFTQNYAESGKIVTYNQVNEIDGFKIYEVIQS